MLSTTASNVALTAARFAPLLTVLGANWTQATNAAPWATREEFGAVTLNGQMWLLGGNGSNGLLNDVWFSQSTTTNMLGSYYLYQQQ